MIRRILHLPHIRVHNANALSSPFTIGFPAMTAWLGATHALQLKLNSKDGQNICFRNVAVICHKIDLQTHKGAGDFVYSIIGTGNPLDKNGARPAFIEEARCHLDISLLIEYSGIDRAHEETVKEQISHHLNASMKIAGGDILSFNEPTLHRIDENDDKELRQLTRRLMPGYAIVERRELMVEAMKQGKDGIDALLDYLAIHHSCEKDDAGDVTWSSHRKTAGWIVPIATGFHGITELGQARNQRDPTTPHRFAESVVTLGEFRMPHRISSLDEMFWCYHNDLENNLYLCQQTSRND